MLCVKINIKNIHKTIIVFDDFHLEYKKGIDGVNLDDLLDDIMSTNIRTDLFIEGAGTGEGYKFKKYVPHNDIIISNTNLDDLINEINQEIPKKDFDVTFNLDIENSDISRVMLNIMNTKYLGNISNLELTDITKKYPFSRFHNVNYRSFDSPYTIYIHGIYPDRIKSLSGFHYHITNIDHMIEFSKKIVLFREFLIAIINGNMNEISIIIDSIYKGLNVYDDYKNYFTSDALKTSPYNKLHKQLQAINVDDNLKTTFIQFVTKIIIHKYDTIVHPHIDKLREMIDNQESLNDIKNYIHDEIFMCIGVCVFDAYTISRVVKCMFNYDSNLIMIYMGRNHTLMLRKYIFNIVKGVMMIKYLFNEITNCEIIFDQIPTDDRYDKLWIDVGEKWNDIVNAINWSIQL